jgi:hypothetical protein
MHFGLTLGRMSDDSARRPLLERWLALLVRYWASNMTLIHDRGTSWPGFGYTQDEKAQLQSIARSVPGPEYLVWLALVVIIFILILAVVVIAGMNALPPQAAAPLFFLQLGFDLIISLSVGFPAAMLPAAALTGRWFAVSDGALPDRAATAHYFRRLWFQITRVALAGVLVLIPLWIFVPADSRVWAIGQLVLPLLSPAVAALTSAYYLSGRLRRSAGAG